MTSNVASKYFTMREMRCHDGTPYPADKADRLVDLFSQLDVIREAYAAQLSPEDLEQFEGLIVISGYRTPAHNGRVGGAGQSQHVEGRAVDAQPKFKHRKTTFSDIHKLHHVIDVQIAAKKLPLVGGVGVYPLHRKPDGTTEVGWVHVDTRPRPDSGHIARWEGAKVGDEQFA